jgi:hypothetical protein
VPTPRAATSCSGPGPGTDTPLAHELTHVIQQRQGHVAGADDGSGIKVSDPFDVSEKTAEANADRVMRTPLSQHPLAPDSLLPARTGDQQTPVVRPAGRERQQTHQPGLAPSAAAWDDARYCASSLVPVAEPPAVQRTVGNAATPRALGRDEAAEPVAVQRTVRLVNRPWMPTEENKPKVFEKGQPKMWREDQKEAVWNELENMASAQEDRGRYGSYVELAMAANSRVNQAAASNLPPYVPGKISIASPDAMEVDSMEVDGTPPLDVKIKRLGELRRRLSLQSVSVGHEGFRNRDIQVADFQYAHGGGPFTIGYTNNFLLGGQLGHSYADLLKTSLNESGLRDQEVAMRLIGALTDPEGGAFDGLRSSAKAALTKIVALIHGAEYRRAAANPVAAVAALNEVVAGRTRTVLEAIKGSTLFGKTDGGAADSQYHRRTDIATGDADFQQRAAGEYDAIDRLARLNGWDGENEDQFYERVATIGAATMQTFTEKWTWRT